MPRKPDLAAMARAVERFLDAAGIDRNGETIGTPRRVAQAWAAEFLDGYRADPARILATSSPGAGDLIAVTDIEYTSVCPHHLLPYRGVAHVAYVPDGRVVGFSKLAKLVDAFAHRLILQEALAKAIAEALCAPPLGARGAACVLEAEQNCMSLRGVKRAHSRALVEAYAGVFRRDAELKRRLHQRVQKGR